MNATRASEPTFDEAWPAWRSMGLSCDPFAATDDPRFFFLDTERKQRLDMLHHLVQYSDEVLVVCGPPGIGKTTLAGHLARMLADHAPLGLAQGDPGSSPFQLYRELLSSFGLDRPGNASEGADLLLGGLDRLPATDLPPVALVDDADLLPAESLAELFRLTSHPGRQRPRLILFASQRLEELLSQPGYDQLHLPLAHTLELPPFSPQATADYIDHRLRAAGLEGGNPLSPSQLRTIHRQSGGVPERIHRAAQALLFSGDDPARGPSLLTRWQAMPPHLRTALVAGLFIATLAAAAVWQINRVEPPEELPGLTERSLADRTVRTLDLLEPSPPPPAMVDRDLGLEPLPLVGPEHLPEPPPRAEPPSISQPPPPVATPESPPHAATPTAPAISALHPDPLIGSEARQTLRLEGSGFTPESTVSVSWAGRTRQLERDQVRFIDPAQLEISITTGTRARPWTVQVSNPDGRSSRHHVFEVVAPETPPPATAPTPAVAPPQTAETSETTLQGDGWIRSRQPDRLTVQVLGSHSREAIPAYARERGLPPPLAIATTRRDGRNWYLLLAGDHADRASASAAAAEIEQRTGNRPWIRRFGDIQEALTAAGAPAAPEAPRAPTPEPVPTMEPVSVPEPAPAPTPATVEPQPAAPQAIRSESWIWAQNPSDYTLQLLTGNNRAALEEVIARHQLVQTAIYRLPQEGESRYVLILGAWNSAGAARTAANTLPEAIRNAGPWPRPFSALHQELAGAE